MLSEAGSSGARTLVETLSRFAVALEGHRAELDSLNVYPVPDGDTGTNLALTQRGVMDELERVSPGDPVAVRDAIARASLMSARGNSGVILAQVLRTLADDLCVDGGGPLPVAAALDRAAREARRAVAKPAEGTVLSVLADASRAATDAEGRGVPVAAVAEAALAGGRESLERTRLALPELRAAGVVDAGGKGALLLLDALASTLSGRDPGVPVGPSGPVGRSEGEGNEPPTFSREVVYLVRGDDAAVPLLAERLGGLGDSIVIVGGDGMYRVHVHTDDPESAVAAALEVGPPSDVRVEDLAAQAAGCVAGQARAARVAELPASALVAVADGDGVGRILRSLGAVVPPTGDGAAATVRAAVERAGAATLLLVPASDDAERLAGGAEARVVTAPTAPQALAAAAAFNPAASPDENAAAMSDAVAECMTASISRAGPGGSVHGVREDQWIGRLGERVVAVGADAASVAARVVTWARSDRHELVTVLAGADVTDDEATEVVAAIRSALPGMEVESHRGDQRGFPFLVGLE